MLETFLDSNFAHIIRTVHHNGFMRIPLWKHIKIHFKLWRSGCGRVSLKHLYKEEKIRRELRRAR